MGDTEHGHLEDRGMGGDGVLDVGGVDVVAAADDHVLAAAHDVEVAVRVEPAEVAGHQPAVHPGPGRGLGVAVVLAGPARDPHAHLADLAGRHRRTVVVDADDLGRGQRLAHRSGRLDGLARRHEAVDGAGLGHAVVVGHQRLGQLRLEALQHGGGERGAAHRALLDRAEVGGVEAGVVEEEGGHGGHQEDEAGPLRLHGVEPGAGVEAREVDAPQTRASWACRRTTIPANV